MAPMRVSIGCYTTEQDIQRFFHALDNTLAELDENAGYPINTKVKATKTLTSIPIKINNANLN